MADVHAKLAQRYASTEWATAWEVPNTTGGGSRRCDLMAMHVWKSKGGICLHGHEIKVSRSDWLKEINDVSKAEEFAKRCHYWWICAPKGIVKLEELPPAWGLLHCTDKTSMRVAKPAGKNRNPEAISWMFFAACMRAFSQQSDLEAKLRREYSRGYEAARKVLEPRFDERVQRAERISQNNAERLQRSIDNFEIKSGVKIDAYHGGRIGRAVKLAMSMNGIEGLKNTIDQSLAAIEALKALATSVSDTESVLAVNQIESWIDEQGQPD